MNTDSYLHEHEVHTMDYRESDCLRAQLREAQATISELREYAGAFREQAESAGTNAQTFQELYQESQARVATLSRAVEVVRAAVDETKGCPYFASRGDCDNARCDGYRARCDAVTALLKAQPGVWE